MKLMIESTETLVEVDGTPARVWRGLSEHGVECVVFVSRIAVDATQPLGADFLSVLGDARAPIVKYRDAGEGT